MSLHLRNSIANIWSINLMYSRDWSICDNEIAECNQVFDSRNVCPTKISACTVCSAGKYTGDYCVMPSYTARIRHV